MEVAEIVMALRETADSWDGSETSELLQDAVDALETLQAKLIEVSAERDALLKQIREPIKAVERGE